MSAGIIVKANAGDSLIEVLIALSLAAVTALGVIAAQTWLARNERALLTRERAALIADSVADAIRSDADRILALAAWRGRASVMLPQGDVALLERGDNVRIVLVKWRSDADEPCVEPESGSKLACVAVAFAR